MIKIGTPYESRVEYEGPTFFAQTVIMTKTISYNCIVDNQSGPKMGVAKKKIQRLIVTQIETRFKKSQNAFRSPKGRSYRFI